MFLVTRQQNWVRCLGWLIEIILILRSSLFKPFYNHREKPPPTTTATAPATATAAATATATEKQLLLLYHFHTTLPWKPSLKPACLQQTNKTGQNQTKTNTWHFDNTDFLHLQIFPLPFSRTPRWRSFFWGSRTLHIPGQAWSLVYTWEQKPRNHHGFELIKLGGNLICWGYPRPTNSGKWRFIGGPS